jgi:glycine cleavage system transcriptional repressor
MQLIINVLGEKKETHLADIFTSIDQCKCSVLEIRSSKFFSVTACYMLIEGNWNHIAKLENTLDVISKKTEITIIKSRLEKDSGKSDLIPYTLETISLNKKAALTHISGFLFERNIQISEINGSCYQAPYLQTSVFSSKIIIFIPPDIGLLALREELLDFCDQLNIDAILEPIKR